VAGCGNRDRPRHNIAMAHWRDHFAGGCSAIEVLGIGIFIDRLFGSVTKGNIDSSVRAGYRVGVNMRRWIASIRS